MHVYLGSNSSSFTFLAKWTPMALLTRDKRKTLTNLYFQQQNKYYLYIKYITH